MLLTPGNRFQYQLNNFGTTQPSGTSITPGNNTMGSWTALLAATARETYEVNILLSNSAVAATARDGLVDIGMDPAGGTSYVVIIPTLFASCASASGIKYVFPLRIPAGATIAARAQVNDAAVTALRVAIQLLGKPTRPELMAYGDRVQALGANAAASNGTTFTPVNGSKGSWVSLGTLTYPAWHWQLGLGINDSTMTLLAYLSDLAADNNATPTILIGDMSWFGNGAEAITHQLQTGQGAPVPAGATIYTRTACHGGSIDNGVYSAIAYACG